MLNPVVCEKETETSWMLQQVSNLNIHLKAVLLFQLSAEIWKQLPEDWKRISPASRRMIRKRERAKTKSHKLQSYFILEMKWNWIKSDTKRTL